MKMKSIGLYTQIYETPKCDKQQVHVLGGESYII
jgi:hypothetical protein